MSTRKTLQSLLPHALVETSSIAAEMAAWKFSQGLGWNSLADVLLFLLIVTFIYE